MAEEEKNVQDEPVEEGLTEEVESVSWMTIDEIENLIKSDLFLQNHVDEFYRTMKILNKL